MGDLPPINSLLYVTVRKDANYRSRIEETDGDLLTVAAPLGAGELEVPGDGEEFEVFWTGVRVRHVLPVRMLGQTRGGLNRWHLLALAEPRRQTRRGFVRGGGPGSAEITLLDTEDSPTRHGAIVDLSEAGLRCRVPADLPDGQLAVVSFGLDGRTLRLSGTVYGTRPAPASRDRDLVITYSPTETSAQEIRRHVFRWEVAERRRQLDDV